LRVLVRVFFEVLRIGRTVEVPACDVLTFVAVEVLQVGLSDFPGSPTVDNFINDGYGWLCENTYGRNDNFEFVAAITQGQQQLVFPVDQDVANLSVGEGGGGTTSTGIENRNIGEELLHVVENLGLIPRSEEHTSELQSRENLVCRLLLEKKKNKLRPQLN